MTSEQVTLLSHATEELQKAQKLLMAQSEQRQPLPLETASVAEKLGISSSTLNRAKRKDKLPYKRLWNDKIAEVYFSHSEKGKDYWIVWVKKTG